MKNALWIGATALLAVSALSACAAGQSGLPLFEQQESSDWADPAEVNPQLVRSRVVKVAFEYLQAMSPSVTGSVLPIPIEFNFFEEVSQTVLFSYVEPRWPSTFQGLPVEPIGYIWHGETTGSNPAKFIMVSGPESCFLQTVIGDHWYQLLGKGEAHIVREYTLDESGLPCVATAVAAAEPIEAHEGNSFSPESSGCDDGHRIDIIVLYTPEARKQVALLAQGNENDHSFIEAKIDLAIRESNEAYEESEIETTLRLLCKGEVNYVENASQTLAGILDELEFHDGTLDEIHALRTSLHADLVSLIVHYGTDHGGMARTMLEESPTFESSAFSVCKHGYMDHRRVLTHETAHNMGCEHNRSWFTNCAGNCACKQGVFHHSFGYGFTGDDDNFYNTIMSLQSGRRIPNFSNPNVEYSGQPTGIPDPSCDSADNSRTITATRDTVAGFRKGANVANTTSLMSLTTSGLQATNGDSSAPAISDDGRCVAFASEANNLFGGDTNGSSDVFVYDRELATLEVKSGKEGAPANGPSYQVVISGDGRSIAYASDATNLVFPNETNAFTDIYVRNGNVANRLSVLTSSPTTGGNNHSKNPSISANGRFVVFESLASDLDESLSDANGFSDIFVRDRDKDSDNILEESGASNSETSRLPSYNPVTEPNGPSFNPAISADGVWIAFESDATNFLAFGQDTNNKRDIFMRNRVTGATIRASVGPSGLQSDGHSFNPSISHDGRFVAFQSEATNLLGTGNDTNNAIDVFVYDRVAGTTICVSRENGATGALGNGDSYDAFIAPSGKYVAFTSAATNFESSNNNQIDVFVRSLSHHTTTRMSVSTSGTAGNGASGKPALSGFGQYIVFQSAATNLVDNDTNSNVDIFFRAQQNVGELSGDYFIDSLDQDILLQNWSLDRPCCAADLDNDDDVDIDDFAMQLMHWWDE